MLRMKINIIIVVLIYVFCLAYIAGAQENKPPSNPNIPTNPNDPTFPRDPNQGQRIIVPPPNKVIVIPDVDDNPRIPDNNPNKPDRNPPRIPDYPNNPGRVPGTPDRLDPEPEIPREPIAEPEIPRDPVAEPDIPTVPDVPEQPQGVPKDPVVDQNDPNIPRPDDQIPAAPKLPDDPSLIQPDMETEFLTAPVFKDVTPKILESDLNNYIPNQVLVLLEGSSEKQQDIDSLSQSYNINSIDSSVLSSINATMVLFEIPDNRGVIDVSRTLAADSRTLAAQPNFYFEGMSENNIQYGVQKIKADSAHSISTGKGIKVAVIDTGIDYSHKAIANKIFMKSDFVDTGSYEFDVHGTSIAGIIASTSIEDGITGVAPDVKIIAARACWKDPKNKINTLCSSNTLAKALNYAILNKAHIINLSLGGPKDNIVSLLITKASRAGIVIVAAAGNGGPKGKPVYPAALKEVIAVSATDSDDKLYQSSTRGKYIDLSAPGVDILSTAPGNSWQVISGTSMAAAHVTGAIALVLQKHPELSAFQMKSLLGSTSIDLGKKGKDIEFGEGRIDALSALHKLKTNP
ncbi:MAG: hypothetical protein DHS20C13_11050 [Thermodesulfobacteriota bacterium]|nr:MAG: hypothetical protein DHS20C13_11050 [Thermodesulfobacteriota bacterium]